MKAKVIKTGEIVDVYHETQHGQVSNIYKEAVFVNGRMWSEDELDFCVKANEAPEKIYSIPTEGGFYLTAIKPEPPFTDGIEYTRTDAFIDKALAYLNERFYFNNLHYAIENNSFNCMEEMYEDFRNYMKGE